MKHNTALQELSIEIDEIISYSIDRSQIIALNAVQNKIINYLPKERQQIIDGYNQGYRDGENNTEINTTKDVSEFNDANDYFIQIFKQ